MNMQMTLTERAHKQRRLCYGCSDTGVMLVSSFLGGMFAEHTAGKPTVLEQPNL